jgi:hypothetical protein
LIKYMGDLEPKESFASGNSRMCDISKEYIQCVLCTNLILVNAFLQFLQIHQFLNLRALLPFGEQRAYQVCQNT